MSKVVSWLSVFFANCKLSINKSMAYRLNFLLEALISLLFTLVGPIMQYLLFTQTKGYPGWNLNEILLFQGVLLFSMGLKSTLFGNFKSQFISLVRQGDLDRLLLRPYSPNNTLLATSFNQDGIVTMLTGLAIIIYISVSLNLAVTFSAVVLFVLCMVFAMIMGVSLDIFHNGIIVLTVADGGLQGIMNAYLRFAEYPIQIYPKLLQVAFTTVFPIAMYIYFPTQALLGRMDLTLLYALAGILLFVFMSLVFWHIAIKKYTSAGG